LLKYIPGLIVNNLFIGGKKRLENIKWKYFTAHFDTLKKRTFLMLHSIQTRLMFAYFFFCSKVRLISVALSFSLEPGSSEPLLL